MAKALIGFAALTAIAGLAAIAVLAAAAPVRFEPLLGLDAYLPVPEDNPLTAQKVALGERLFNDPLLSRDKSVSCATCHEPENGFTDRRPTAVGVFERRGTRRVPKLVNRGYGKSFFWDGRIPTLEKQVVQPILNELEMDLTIEESVERLRGDGEYAAAFWKAFDREVNGDDLARALASYVRTLVSGNSRYDQYVAGDRSALSEAERAGLEIFRGKGDCTLCHLGPNLSDEQFHNTGISWKDGVFTDEGRFTVTKIERDRGAFKTPTLREVARTAPYMHDGSLAALEDVVEFYDKGGRANPNLDREIQALRLTRAEKTALLAFLGALSGTVRAGL